MFESTNNALLTQGQFKNIVAVANQSDTCLTLFVLIPGKAYVKKTSLGSEYILFSKINLTILTALVQP